MKTTLDLPDDLMRAVKIRAVERNMKLRELVAEALRAMVAAPLHAAAAAPLDPVQAFGQGLVFLPDGSVSNPAGLDDDSFFDALEAYRSNIRIEPLSSPFDKR